MQKHHGGAVSTSVYRSSSRPRCRLSHCSCWLTSQSCCLPTTNTQIFSSSHPYSKSWQLAQHLHTCCRAWLHVNRPLDHRCTCADAAAARSLSTHLLRLFLLPAPEKHTAALLFLDHHEHMQSIPHTPHWNSCAAENCPHQTHLSSSWLD